MANCDRCSPAATLVEQQVNRNRYIFALLAARRFAGMESGQVLISHQLHAGGPELVRGAIQSGL